MLPWDSYVNNDIGVGFVEFFLSFEMTKGILILIIEIAQFIAECSQYFAIVPFGLWNKYERLSLKNMGTL